MREPHPLESELNASATDILDAVHAGFRAKVDVKGKLAELYLHRALSKLQKNGEIDHVEWHDKDGKPDFEVRVRGKSLRLECNNIRNEMYHRPEPAYKVELQKTRNSQDGTPTRAYRVDAFDLLAICLFNQTDQWTYRFARASELERREENDQLLKIMQRVPLCCVHPWHSSIMELL